MSELNCWLRLSFKLMRVRVFECVSLGSWLLDVAQTNQLFASLARSIRAQFLIALRLSFERTNDEFVDGRLLRKITFLG